MECFTIRIYRDGNILVQSVPMTWEQADALYEMIFDLETDVRIYKVN